MTKDYTVQGRHVLAKKNLLLVMYELRDNKDKKVMCIYFKKKMVVVQKTFIKHLFFSSASLSSVHRLARLLIKEKNIKPMTHYFSIDYHI
jgi:hypothetical protein